MEADMNAGFSDVGNGVGTSGLGLDTDVNSRVIYAYSENYMIVKN